MKTLKRLLFRAFRTVALLIAILIVVGLIVCLTRTVPAVAMEAMKHSDTFELLSIDPGRSDGGFHGHAVRGSVMCDQNVRDRLIAAMRSGARWNFPLPAMCFNPRHAIHVTHNGDPTDILICFECEQAEVWKGNQRVAWFMMGDGPAATFDQTLKQSLPTTEEPSK